MNRPADTTPRLGCTQQYTKQLIAASGTLKPQYHVSVRASPSGPVPCRYSSCAVQTPKSAAASAVTHCVSSVMSDTEGGRDRRPEEARRQDEAGDHHRHSSLLEEVLAQHQALDVPPRVLPHRVEA